jgi:hypothetical protein
MKSVIAILLFSACYLTCTSSPVKKEVDWENAEKRTTEFGYLVGFSLDKVRNIVQTDGGVIGFQISERIIHVQRNIQRIFNEVLDLIRDHELTCEDVRFYSREVIDMFVDLITFVLGAEINEGAQGQIAGLYVGTYVDSTVLANQIAMLLGCPKPKY